MLSIQIISLIIFVMGIVIMPIIDQLFFYNAFNFKSTTVDKPVTKKDFKNFKERNREMVEPAQLPVVNKEARVIEEVGLGKNAEERSETIRDTVSKPEVNVGSSKRMI